MEGLPSSLPSPRAPGLLTSTSARTPVRGEARSGCRVAGRRTSPRRAIPSSDARLVSASRSGPSPTIAAVSCGRRRRNVAITSRKRSIRLIATRRATRIRSKSGRDSLTPAGTSSMPPGTISNCVRTPRARSSVIALLPIVMTRSAPPLPAPAGARRRCQGRQAGEIGVLAPDATVPQLGDAADAEVPGARSDRPRQPVASRPLTNRWNPPTMSGWSRTPATTKVSSRAGTAPTTAVSQRVGDHADDLRNLGQGRGRHHGDAGAGGGRGERPEMRANPVVRLIGTRQQNVLRSRVQLPARAEAAQRPERPQVEAKDRPRHHPVAAECASRLPRPS